MQISLLASENYVTADQRTDTTGQVSNIGLIRLDICSIRITVFAHAYMGESRSADSET